MAGMATGARGAPQSEPNVVPMIDILLVLLIIFMIAQPLARMAMNVQVPPEETSDTPEAAKDQIVLELRDDKSYAINGQPYTREELEGAFHTIYDQRPAKLLFIKAGPSRLYQEVIEAMDIARGAGVQVIGFTPKEAK